MTEKKRTPRKTATPKAESEAASNVVSLPARPEPTAADKAVEFVRDHPVASVAGGIVAGMVLSALLPRRPARQLATRAISLAEAASAASLLLGRNILDHAESAGHSVRETAGDIAGRAGRLGHAAYERAGRAGEAALDRAERLGGAARGRITGMLPRRKPKSLAEKVAARAEELAAILRR